METLGFAIDPEAQSFLRERRARIAAFPWLARLPSQRMVHRTLAATPHQLSCGTVNAQLDSMFLICRQHAIHYSITKLRLEDKPHLLKAFGITCADERKLSGVEWSAGTKRECGWGGSAATANAPQTTLSPRVNLSPRENFYDLQ
jgi:hypothetical protein